MKYCSKLIERSNSLLFPLVIAFIAQVLIVSISFCFELIERSIEKRFCFSTNNEFLTVDLSF